MQLGPEGLTARAEFNTDLFDGSTISRMLGHFRVLLEAVVADPELRLAQLPLLTEPERRQLLLEWNKTERAFPTDLWLHELFEAQAHAKPDNVAVSIGDRQLSYRRLNECANRLAHFLIRRGLGPGSRSAFTSSARSK
jgi:non-ribosomal peptide synthetase component F